VGDPHNLTATVETSTNNITWDPYQSGSIGTPEHQRTNAGDVHRAHLGILYMDEIKNLQPFEAVTLLTVLEEGELPIAHRATHSGSGTAALALATDPVPSLCFFIAAGNFDSIPKIHPALMDRIVGYGSVIRMNNDIPNIVENRRKYVQFISQELKRFRYQPFTRGACEEIVAEGRRRSGWRDKLTTRFRPMIDIIIKSSQLARNEGEPATTARHVKEAIDEHCKTIQKQLLEQMVVDRKKLLIIEPDAPPMKGRMYGLYVYSGGHGTNVGVVGRITAFIRQKNEIEGDEVKGFCKVTGIAKDGEWIDDSVARVRSVIMKRYGVDIAQQYFSHIDFTQSRGVDGPSAGVTMTLLLCSLIEGKPLKQNVAVTGAIDIESSDEILITAIGGAHEKIKAAEQWGFKKVLIPKSNYDHSVEPTDYKLEIIGCRTLDEYLKHVLVD